MEPDHKSLEMVYIFYSNKIQKEADKLFEDGIDEEIRTKEMMKLFRLDRDQLRINDYEKWFKCNKNVIDLLLEEVKDRLDRCESRRACICCKKVICNIRCLKCNAWYLSEEHRNLHWNIHKNFCDVKCSHCGLKSQKVLCTLRCGMVYCSAKCYKNDLYEHSKTCNLIPYDYMC